MRELSQIRDAVVSALAAEGVAALDAYPDQRARRYGCPVAAVAVETAESRTVGFCNYLGEVFDTGAGAPRELYGKQLEAVISIEIRGQRAADCEQGCETAAEVLLERLPAGIRLFSTIAAGLLMIPSFVVPTPRDLMMLILIGIFGAGGQIGLTYAYQKAPVAEVSIYDYSGIIFSAILGYVLLDESLSLSTIVGAALITAGGLWSYCANRKQAGADW